MEEDLLRSVFTKGVKKDKKRDWFKKCRFGFWREFENRDVIKSFLHWEWNFKNRRPLKVVYRKGNRVCFILTSTSDNKDPHSQTDIDLGNPLPRFDFEECVKENPLCDWIRNGWVRVFKIPPYGYVFYTSVGLLKEISEYCGECTPYGANEDLKKVLEYELSRKCISRGRK